MYLRPKQINRRHFLAGAGGAMLGLPFLNAMARSGSVNSPTRMVCIGNSFGFLPRSFFPQQAGANYEMPGLLENFEPHRSDFTILSNLDHRDAAIGGHNGVPVFLSGVPMNQVKGYKDGNITVDQKAARHVGADTRFPSMQFSCGKHMSLSWSGSGSGIPPEDRLTTIFSSLFQKVDGNQVDILKAAQLRKKSVLDLVRTDARQLERQIGKADREKLDQYFTSIRGVERKLTQTSIWLDKPMPEVDYQLPVGADSLDFVDRLPLYYDLMVLALQTDSTRVISLQVGKETSGLELTKNYHQLTHHGKNEDSIRELLKIEEVHTKNFARFLDQLSAIREPNGERLIDSTMSLFGSGMGNASSHSNRNLPLILAGGGFQHGRHLQFDGTDGNAPKQELCNLYLTMLQRFGMDVEKFNRSTGTLTGLV